VTQPYLGQVQLFGFNFAPLGWALCHGQTLSISQYAALFSVIGTYYGGNGTSTFQLPNLQGAVAIGAGEGAGLSPYSVGETGGTSTVQVLSSQMPPHNHPFAASTATGTTATAAGAQLGVGRYAASGKSGTSYDAYLYSSNQPTTGLAPQSVSVAGGNLSHNNMQPYLALSYCIAMTGVFPTRN
jgi:microcystin-dependent protein